MTHALVAGSRSRGNSISHLYFRNAGWSSRTERILVFRCSFPMTETWLVWWSCWHKLNSAVLATPQQFPSSGPWILNFFLPLGSTIENIGSQMSFSCVTSPKGIDVADRDLMRFADNIWMRYYHYGIILVDVNWLNFLFVRMQNLHTPPAPRIPGDPVKVITTFLAGSLRTL